MKPKTTKITLAVLVLLSGLFDFITFYFGKLYQFEINPLFLISRSIWLLFAVKFVVLGGLIYLIWTYKPTKRMVWSYCYIFMAVYIIMAQTLGGYSNLQTSQAYTETVGTEHEIQPMQKEEAMVAYTKLNILMLYIPFFIALISFAVWEGIYLCNLKI